MISNPSVIQGKAMMGQVMSNIARKYRRAHSSDVHRQTGEYFAIMCRWLKRVEPA